MNAELEPRYNQKMLVYPKRFKPKTGSSITQRHGVHGEIKGLRFKTKDPFGEP
jgi:hypothetical protein